MYVHPSLLSAPWHNLHSQKFLRTPTESEWARFLLHSIQVRSLVVNCGDSTTHQHTALQTLRVATEGDTSRRLLPGLRSITLSNCADSDVRALPMLMSASLLNVNVSRIAVSVEPGGTNDGQDLVTELAERAPAIRNLHLSRVNRYKTCDALTEHASKFTHLTKFTCDFKVSPDALDQLARLPCLCELDCNVSSAEQPMPVWRRRLYNPGPFFPALRTWRVTVTKWSRAVQKLIEDVSAAPLQKFGLIFRSQHKAAFFASIMVAIAKLSSLTYLQVSLSSGRIKLGPDYLLDEPIISPLYKLRLGILDMPTLPFRLNDDSLEAIGSGLPSLTCLRLGSQYLHKEYTTRSTWKGLMAIAKRCPLLEIIAVSMDINTVRLNELDVPTPRPHLAIQFIKVVAVCIADPAVVAAAMSALFPNAEISTCATAGTPIALEASFREVARLQAIFCRVRNQERAAKSLELKTKATR